MRDFAITFCTLLFVAAVAVVGIAAIGHYGHMLVVGPS